MKREHEKREGAQKERGRERERERERKSWGFGQISQIEQRHKVRNTVGWK